MSEKIISQNVSRKNMIEAIRDALDVTMERDDNVIVFGEDVGYFGGVFRATEGLQAKYGKSRCFDAPISELGIIGAAVGMGAYGLRPVPEIQFADYILPAYDQIASEAARLRYRSSGEFTAPMTIRTPTGGGIYGGQTHSQSPEAFFAHIPGMKVVIPRNPYQAKGLLLASIRDDNPVLFMEPKRLYRASVGEVPEDDYQLPLGKADVVKTGSDITLLAWGAQVEIIEKAAAMAEAEGISCEIIDLQSILPWDVEAVCSSVEKTGRLLINHEAPLTAGFASEIAASVQEKCFLHLESPICRVCGLDTPYPLAHEKEYMPDHLKTFEAIKRTVNF